jgi:PAS domain S-box-containing protein
MPESDNDRLSELKRRAQEALKNYNFDQEAMSSRDMAEVIEELQVYQIELELQNEEMQRLQEELNRQRDKYQDLYEKAPTGYVTIDEKGRIIDANSAFAKMIGNKSTKLAGHPIIDFIHSDSKEIFLTKKKDIAIARHTDQCEIKLANPDGPVFVILRCHPDTDQSDNLDHIKISATDISYRKEMESKIQNANAKLSAISESTIHSIIIINRDFKISTFNRKAAEHAELVYGKEMQSGLSVLEFVRGKDKPAFKKNFRNALQGKDTEVNKIIDTQEGNEIGYSFHYSPVKTHEGEISGVCLSITDLTEQIKHQNEMRKSREQFSKIFHVSHDSKLLIKCDDWKITEVNKTFCDKTQIKRQFIIGRNIAEVSFLTEPGLVSHIFETIDSKGNVKDKEYDHRLSDEIIINFRINGTKVRINDIDYYLISATDITDQKIAEKAVRENELLLQRISDASPSYIYIYDLKKEQNVYTNRSMAEFLGYSPEEIARMENLLVDIIHPDDAAKVPQLHSRFYKASDSDVLKSEYRVRNSRGGYRWMSCHEVIFHRDEDGFPEQILGVNIDITKRREMEQRLIESEKELNEAIRTKDKFFSIISHDLKNPIGGFIGLSEELFTNFRQLSISQIKEISYALHESSRHLYKLLNNLLQWSVIQRQQMRLSKSDINISQAAAQNAELYAINAEEKDIEISNKIDSGFKVMADSDMVDLVLRNLISNAIKFTNPGGKIIIDAKPTGNNFLEISVEDTGVGMEQKQLEQLFNVGALTPSQGTAREKGTGLGLVLCKEVIEKMGGKISADSKFGEGTTFRFTLPRKM